MLHQHLVEICAISIILASKLENNTFLAKQMNRIEVAVPVNA